MDKPLTLIEMVNYEIPNNYQLPLSSFPKFGWNSPKISPFPVFERKLKITSRKYSYTDASREKQLDFLTRSGKINKIKLKYNSGLVKNDKSLPNTCKTSSSFKKNEQKRSLTLFQSNYKPRTASFLEKKQKLSSKTYFASIKKIGLLLNKIKREI